jgi:hypothetical protein
MRAFAAAWPREAIVQRSVAQLPWRHHVALLEKLDNTESLPAELESSLPTVEELEAELADDLDGLADGGEDQ